VNVWYDPANDIDLNPLFAEGDLVGQWRDGQADLELRADGSFTCHGGGACAILGGAGRWARLHDFELSFTPDDGRNIVLRRVVSLRGQLCLTLLGDDLEMWDGMLTFKHVRLAS
jgi:hypothetical protein